MFREFLYTLHAQKRSENEDMHDVLVAVYSFLAIGSHVATYLFLDMLCGICAVIFPFPVE